MNDFQNPRFPQCGIELPGLHFFLDGITRTAKNGVSTADQILQLQKHWEKEIGSWKPRTAHGLKLFTHLFTHPWVNAAQVSEVCTVSPGTAYSD